MGKKILIVAMILGSLAVGLGAFGAHALKEMLSGTGRIETYDTAVKYHFFHVLFLLILGVLSETLKIHKLQWPAYLIAAGIILFSGSLYTLCFTGITLFAFLTPIGGVSLMAGWLYGAYIIYNHNRLQ